MQVCGDSWWMIFFFSQLSRTPDIPKVSCFFFSFCLQHHQPEVLGPLWTHHLQDTTASQWPLHWISFSKLASGQNRDRGVTQSGTSGPLSFLPWFSFTYAWVWASQVVLVVKNPPTDRGDARDAGLIPGLGRSPGGGHGSPLQYSCLENPMNRGAWQTTVYRVAKSNWSNLAHAHT